MLGRTRRYGRCLRGQRLWVNIPNGHWTTTTDVGALRALIADRIRRVTNGLPGSVVPVGEGVSALRIHHGPGYETYCRL